jgi:4-hydroxybenzoate polyprenyltransferase
VGRNALRFRPADVLESSHVMWVATLFVLWLLGWAYHLGGDYIHLLAVAALAATILYMLPARPAKAMEERRRSIR